jgi:hypothetical protein
MTYLDEARCWSISGLRDAEAFFREVPHLVPEATHVFLEGSPSPDIAALLSPHTDQAAYGAPVGTLWSWPGRNHRLVVRASPALFAELTDAARRHAAPEICDHVHLYRDAEPLAQWFDAFADPLLVSDVVPIERAEQFCLVTGGTLAAPRRRQVPQD